MDFLKRENGFTLVEILIAVMILGLVFVSILTAFQKSYSVTWQSQERSVAVNLAREKLELLKCYDNSGYSRDSSVWTDSYTKDNNGITYTISTQVLTGAGVFQTTTEVIPVRVTVYWTSHGKNFSINMDTCYIQNY